MCRIRLTRTVIEQYGGKRAGPWWLPQEGFETKAARGKINNLWRYLGLTEREIDK